MTATCHRSAHLEYCDALPAIIDHFATVAGKLEPEARVPTCPDWSVADLVRHTGGIHRWARTMVAGLSQERLSGKEVTLDLPEHDRDLPAWLAEGSTALVETFREADPDAGVDPTIEPAVAIDGIDEFLDNLPHAEYFAPRVAELRGSGETVVLQDSGRGTLWSITLEADRFSWDHDETRATVLVRATACDLLLFAYGRRTIGDKGISYEGDRPLLDFWVARSSI